MLKCITILCQGATDTTDPSKTNKFHLKLVGFDSIKFQSYKNRAKYKYIMISIQIGLILIKYKQYT